MKLIKFILLTFGIISSSISAAWYFHINNQLKGSLETKGVVADLAGSQSKNGYFYRPVVKFALPDGKEVEFTSDVGSNPAAYNIGDSVAVLYNQSDPYKAMIKGTGSLWGVTLITGVIGITFLLIAMILIIKAYRRQKEIKYLQECGMRITTKLASVEVNTSLTANDRHPYYLVTEWKDPSTGNAHTFESDYVWFDPSEYIKQNNITQVEVLVEKDNFKKYYVDISFLPKKAKWYL